MKKILITARDLKLGGIEKSLLQFLNYLAETEYKVTLVLEKKEGELLKKVDHRVKIDTYSPSTNKNYYIRKITNLINRIKAIVKYKNKFDESISFATYSLPGSLIARIASKNAILWGHADYLSLFKGNKSQVKAFFERIQYSQFSKIVFVSKKAKQTFLEVFPEKKEVTYYCNNLIDYKKIQELSNEEINLKKEEDIFTFLNVGRHDELQKRLTRIIEAAKKLKEENLKFKIIFVGEGKDTQKYKDLVKKYNLTEQIIFVGAKINPYPYFRISDAVILSSDYEGYPVVFLESFILGKPIITTKVSDYEDVENGRGIICEKNVNNIYEKMKKIINEGYSVRGKFDAEKYNNEIKEKLKDII